MGIRPDPTTRLFSWRLLKVQIRSRLLEGELKREIDAPARAGLAAFANDHKSRKRDVREKPSRRRIRGTSRCVYCAVS